MKIINSSRRKPLQTAAEGRRYSQKQLDFMTPEAGFERASAMKTEVASILCNVFFYFLGTARNGLIANGAKRELQQQISHLRGHGEYVDETRDNEENRNHSAAVYERSDPRLSTIIFI